MICQIAANMIWQIAANMHKSLKTKKKTANEALRVNYNTSRR
jgi:hypothetical protein